MNNLHRRAYFFLVGDVVLLATSLITALALRFDGRPPLDVWRQVPIALALSLAVRLPVFARAGLYAVSWSQVSLNDMVAVFGGVTVGTAIFWMMIYLIRTTELLAGFPRAVLLLDYIILLYAIGAFRIARRMYVHFRRQRPRSGLRAVIVGAGAAGEQLARALQDTPSAGYIPAGFVDDDPSKIGAVIHGLRVLGGRDRLPALVGEHHIKVVLIAMPSAPSRVIRNVVSFARQAGVPEIRIVPGLDRFLNGKLSLNDLREVQLTDLLGRETVRIDTVGLGQWLAGLTVAVTGAGGSIGSELCRQIAAFHPRALILIDSDESGLFWIDQELRRAGLRAKAMIGDVRSSRRIREIFVETKPDLVFHAAAYKHVGLMEGHLEEAIVTNVLGTRIVAEASVAAGAEKFVLISTDKAVNPTSVMGASKRAAEQVCLALNTIGPTRVMAVRFGNVLGSRGSVLPLFQERIRRGEPLIVRGPHTERYFMAVEEAVQLVLQAGLMGSGGEIFVLDMGDPVRIVDLAREFVRLSGLEPDKDVPIVVAEPEPGEKEHEDLLTAEEGTVATKHDRIYVAHAELSRPANDVLTEIDALASMVVQHDLPGMIRVLKEVVPTYSPSELLQAYFVAPVDPTPIVG